jgi:hypothetical protein
MNLTRPCTVKLISTNAASRNSRNILAKIIREHGACEIKDDKADGAQEFFKDIDAPPMPAVTGLVVRWATAYTPGRNLFLTLKRNYCNVAEGHAIPNDSPENLILITVGDGYPWPRDASCHD